MESDFLRDNKQDIEQSTRQTEFVFPHERSEIVGLEEEFSYP